jgi:ABC-2 type transport system ATP-binding protein
LSRWRSTPWSSSSPKSLNSKPECPRVSRGHFFFAERYNRGMAAVLEFDGMSKRYRSIFARQERWALRDFSLRIEAGEIVGFLGPNGAGKTTAIHIALGLCTPTAGTGKLLGQKFGDAKARKRIGFLSESPAFYHQKACDVLRFYGALNGVREPHLSRRANELLEAVGLASESARNIGRFSRGMLQRIGVAQALMNDPELLILDEPTSALDPISRLQVRQVLVDARAKGKTVFLSSHQLSEVELVCDRVIFVREGRVIISGKTSELTESASEFEIVAEGICSAPEAAREAHQQDGRWTLIVSKEQQREAMESIWTAGGKVLSVVPQTRTLEELFVKLMNGPESQDRTPS